MRDDHGGHVFSMRQLERELIDNRGHDRVESGSWLIAEE